MKKEHYKYVQSLFEEKSYEELSPEERTLIDQFLSEERLDLFDPELLDLSSFFEMEEQHVQLNPTTRNNLSNSLDAKFSLSSSLWDRLFNLKNQNRALKLTGIAASITVLVFFLSPFNVKSNNKIEDSYFINNTQFIDMDITPEDPTNKELQNMDFFEE